VPQSYSKEGTGSIYPRRPALASQFSCQGLRNTGPVWFRSAPVRYFLGWARLWIVSQKKVSKVLVESKKHIIMGWKFLLHKGVEVTHFRLMIKR